MYKTIAINESTPAASKSFSASYLYNKSGEYEKQCINFLMRAEEIDKYSNAFEDIIYEVKRRQITSVLVEVLKSSKIKLMYLKGLAMPRAFKVFCAKDIRGDKTMKVFIDCSECLSFVDGKWAPREIDKLIAYLVSAMTNAIYFTEPTRFTMNATIIKKGAHAFAFMVNYIIDYLFKTNIIDSKRDAVLYLSAIYFQVNILGKDIASESVQKVAKDISNLSDRPIQVLEMYYDEGSFDNIKNFIDLLSKAIKLDKLTLEAFVEKWVYLYAPGTQFGMELFTSFTDIITNAYIGANINNAKTIEKVIGPILDEYTKAVFAVGNGVLANK